MPRWKSAALAASTGALFALAMMWIGFQVVTHRHTGILRSLAAARQLVTARSATSQAGRLKEQATAGPQHSVTLTWKASATPGARYNVYRRGLTGGWARLNAVPVVETTFTDNSVQAGQIYFYSTRAVSSGSAESTPSNEVRVEVPTS